MKKTLNVSVEIDNRFIPQLNCQDRTSLIRTIPMDVVKLIFMIGTIQTRRFAPSNRQKFTDKEDLIEKLHTDTKDFKIRINQIRNTGGQEILKTISEDFGVGISVLIADNLFNINLSTVQRIFGRKKRPDWSCLTKNNRVLIVESKGSVRQSTLNRSINNALEQKSRRLGDIKAASLTLLQENTISTNRFLDPPIEPDNVDLEHKYRILQAGHYSSVFSFLGESELSKYFTQMRHRLQNTITQREQTDKNELLNKIKKKYSTIQFQNKAFQGTFYQINNNRYLLIGVDIELISYHGFVHFSEYKEVSEIINENNYYLFQDGILLVDIYNISTFKAITDLSLIKNYQDNNSISDIDSMTDISFQKYIVYLLKKNGFAVISEPHINNSRFDIIGLYNDQEYVFELKLFKTRLMPKYPYEQVYRSRTLKNIRHVFITNAQVPNEFMIENKNMTFIGRNELIEIIRNFNKLTELI